MIVYRSFVDAPGGTKVLERDGDDAYLVEEFFPIDRRLCVLRFLNDMYTQRSRAVYADNVILGITEQHGNTIVWYMR